MCTPVHVTTRATCTAPCLAPFHSTRGIRSAETAVQPWAWCVVRVRRYLPTLRNKFGALSTEIVSMPSTQTLTDCDDKLGFFVAAASVCFVSVLETLISAKIADMRVENNEWVSPLSLHVPISMPHACLVRATMILVLASCGDVRRRGDFHEGREIVGMSAARLQKPCLRTPGTIGVQLPLQNTLFLPPVSCFLWPRTYSE